jgi:hypothetical protein
MYRAPFTDGSIKDQQYNFVPYRALTATETSTVVAPPKRQVLMEGAPFSLYRVRHSSDIQRALGFLIVY